MRNRFIFAIFLLSSGWLWAQEQSTVNVPADAVISNYMTGADAYAALYTGKTEVPYTISFTNHPYFETVGYVKGTLCYNRVVYKDVLMRLDLYKDEMTVRSPNIMYSIVLDKEKFDYAILNGSTIINSIADRKTNGKYIVLLKAGTYPVVKIHNLRIMKEQTGLVLRDFFSIEQQYAIYSNGTLYPVKSKNSILKLFPDRKKELNAYAKLHNLDFSKRTVQSIIALVNHYETLSGGTQMTQISAKPINENQK